MRSQLPNLLSLLPLLIVFTAGMRWPAWWESNTNPCDACEGLGGDPAGDRCCDVCLGTGTEEVHL